MNDLNLFSDLNSSKELVSIIIPCYNYGRFLSDCLNSIVSQSYKNIELIILDDGSIDNSRQVAYTFMKRDNRIKYYWQENKGYPGMHNMGLELAKGEYIIFIDADDMMGDKNLIQTYVKYLSSHPNTFYVYGLTQKIDSFGNIISKPYGKNVSGYLTKLLIKGDFIPLGSMMVRKNDKNNILFDYRVPYMLDYLYKLRVSTLGLGKFINILALKYRIHSMSVSRNRYQLRKNILDSLIIAQKELYDHAKKRDWDIALSIAYFNLAKEEELCGNIKKAIRYYKESMSINPLNYKASILLLGAYVGGILKYKVKINKF